MKKILSLALIMSSLVVIAKESAPALSWQSTKVSENLYMLSGVGGFTGGNLGLSVGEDGVILIDDAMPSTLDIMNQAIKGITEAPIDFLINTHVHGDHTGNNQTVGEKGAHIVAHKNLRNSFLSKGVQGPEGMVPAPKASLPVITYTDSMEFHLNGLNAQLLHTPNAHTDGDTVVYFENINAIHMGDTFFNGLFPYIDAGNGGSVAGYIAAQQKVLSMIDDETKIIPGHGPLATKADLQASNDMLVDASQLVSALVHEGKSEAEILELNPLKKYHDKWNWGFITTEKMTQQMIQGASSTETHTH
jgi:glyoxylase-like metal-dependent hydrolase (beta-lactamase superfamily II)